MEQNDLTLISDYLADQLNVDERVAVHKRLDQDPTFAELFREQEQHVRILHASGRADVKAEVRTQFDQFQSNQAPQPIISFRWGYLAAAAVVAILLAIWLIPGEKMPESQQLAMAYLEPFPLNMERGEGQAIVTLQDSAFALYQTARYAEALPLFQRLHQASPNAPHIGMYLGECLSQTGAYSEATVLFEFLSKNSPFQDAARWRLALNHYLAGDQKNAVSVLEEIQGTTHYRAAQADSLLRSFQP